MSTPALDQVLLFCHEISDVRGTRLDYTGPSDSDYRNNISVLPLSLPKDGSWPSGGAGVKLPADEKMMMNKNGLSHHIAAAYDKNKNEAFLVFPTHLNTAGNTVMMYRIGKYISPISLLPAGKPSEKDEYQQPHDAPSILVYNSLINVGSWTESIQRHHETRTVDGQQIDIVYANPTTQNKCLLNRLVETPEGRVWKATGINLTSKDKNYRSPKLYYPTEFQGSIKYIYNIQLKAPNDLYVETLSTYLFDKAIEEPVQWKRHQVGGSFGIPSSPTTDHGSSLPEALILKNKKTGQFLLWIFLALGDGNFSYFYLPLREDGSISGEGTVGGIGWNPAQLKDVQHDASKSYQNSISALTWNNRVFLFLGVNNKCRFLSCPVPDDGILPPTVNDWTVSSGDVNMATNNDPYNLVAYCAVKVAGSFVQ